MANCQVVVLRFFHSIVGNWGWSIILLTRRWFCGLYLQKVIVLWRKDCTRNATHERRVRWRPYAQEMMALYKREQVNPLSGYYCYKCQFSLLCTGYSWKIASCAMVRLDSRLVSNGSILPLIMGATMFAQQMLNLLIQCKRKYSALCRLCSRVVLPCGSGVVLDCEQQY